MTQHLLDGAQIRTVLQQVGGKRVAQRMGGDVLLDTRFLLVVLDELPEALTAHPLAAHVDKQGGLLRRFHQLRPDLGYVVAERPDRGVVQGDDSLPPLAFAVEHPGGQIQVVYIQGDELADPDSGGIEQLQHSPVPEALQVGTVGLLQKQFHFLTG